jgi:hypothetical protein
LDTEIARTSDVMSELSHKHRRASVAAKATAALLAVVILFIVVAETVLHFIPKLRPLPRTYVREHTSLPAAAAWWPTRSSGGGIGLPDVSANQSNTALIPVVFGANVSLLPPFRREET